MKVPVWMQIFEYAIIVTGGKQYRVEQGDIVYIEKLDADADKAAGRHPVFRLLRHHPSWHGDDRQRF